MLYKYLVRIRHHPKYSNGAYRSKYISCNARNSGYAILQAIDYCDNINVDPVKLDVEMDGVTNLKKRFDLLKSKS